MKQELYDICAEIFSGKFNNNRVDGGNKSLNYNGLLIKDIFANLLSYSVSLHFPTVKPILLIRNPFAVALSKYKKKDWFWVTEPLDLFNQIALREDYLLPFEDIIRKTSAKKDYLLNQILIWSIINYVPLRQFKLGSIHYCFYENLFSEPSLEVSKIFEFVRSVADNSQDVLSLSNEVVNRPSRVVGNESNILSGTSPITSWKKEISYGVVEEGLEILKHFDLDDLYDENSMPNENVLRRIQELE